MKNSNTQKEVEEIVALMFPNQFLQRDLRKLEVIYIAGITKGLAVAKETIAKCENKNKEYYLWELQKWLREQFFYHIYLIPLDNNKWDLK